MSPADTDLVDDELVYTPNAGFRSARVLESPTNLVVERDGCTLTASLVSDRDCTTLHFTVLGFDAPAEIGTRPSAYYQVKEAATVRDDRGREISPHPRWHTGGMIRRRGDGTLMLDWQLKLVRLASDVRSVALSFGGAAGEWTVGIPVEVTEIRGTPATHVNASDVHHGITVAARAVARPSDHTAIEIETDVAPDVDDLPNRPKRYVQGIATHNFGRLASELLVLRDDRGNQHLERPAFGHTPAPRNRQVVTFRALPEDVRSGVIEIPFVAVQERTDDTITLPVPSHGEVRFLGCDAQVSVVAVEGRDGKRVRVAITPKDPDAERQILYFTRTEVIDGPEVGVTFQHCAGQPVIVETPDPHGSPTVTLRGPVMRLGGPWSLALQLA